MKEILQNLASLFSDKFNKKLERAESLEELIVKLEKKQLKLEKKLKTTPSETEQSLYQSQLTVLKTQLEKAKNLQQQNIEE